MANPASLDDIESRWRPLSTQEATNAQVRLDDAWRMLKRILPTIEADVAADAELEAESVRVLCDAVLRVLKNPDGHKSGTRTIEDASRSWTLADSRASGELYFTDAEIAALTGGEDVAAQAFSVVPS